MPNKTPNLDALSEFDAVRRDLEALRARVAILERWLASDHNARCAFDRYRRNNAQKK